MVHSISSMGVFNSVVSSVVFSSTSSNRFVTDNLVEISISVKFSGVAGRTLVLSIQYG